MPLTPPFTFSGAKLVEHPVKRAATGKTKGATLRPGRLPDAEIRVTYRKQFRFHRVYDVRDATPYWQAADKDRLAEARSAGTLSAGSRMYQVDEYKDARKRAKFGKVRITFALLRPEAGGAKVWVPLIRHPEGKKGWRAPKRVGPTHQWGIRGDFSFKKPSSDGPSKDSSSATSGKSSAKQYKMVTVWERWTDRKPYPRGPSTGKWRWTNGLMIVAPGTYAGYVKVIPKHSSAAGRKKFPSIWVIWEWQTDKWVKQVPSAKSSSYRVSGVFLHPGSWPSWFLGCMSPGPVDKATGWGFADIKDCRKAMWEILNEVGITEANFGSHRYPTRKAAKWFIIRVEDPGKVCQGGPT
ncbi:MAG: hypothetical protein ACE5I3_06920 [Phycisphaerae bacterium]